MSHGSTAPASSTICERCPVSELLPRTNTAEPAEVAEQFVSVFASSEETNQGYAASEIGEGQ
jgi:hypothetical protein